jgi:hypothetical protein
VLPLTSPKQPHNNIKNCKDWGLEQGGFHKRGGDILETSLSIL